MAIDPTRQVSASVVLEKETYEKLRGIATREKRSVSKQIAYWIEEKLDKESV